MLSSSSRASWRATLSFRPAEPDDGVPERHRYCRRRTRWSKETGLPVCRLIGPGAGTIECLSTRRAATSPREPQRDFPPQIEAMAEAGYAAVKIKIGLGPKSDLERVAFARNHLGGRGRHPGRYQFELYRRSRESLDRSPDGVLHRLGGGASRTPGLRRLCASAANESRPDRDWRGAHHGLRFQAPARRGQRRCDPT